MAVVANFVAFYKSEKWHAFCELGYRDGSKTIIFKKRAYFIIHIYSSNREEESTNNDFSIKVNFQILIKKSNPLATLNFLLKFLIV
jgi:hypothetical protein